MITLIILTVLTLFGIYLLSKGWDYEFSGALITTFSGIFLLLHIIFLSTASYSHEMFVVRRAAFETTLNEARKNGNEYETAAIVKEVAGWNTELAERKYNNKTLFLDQYNDDRIELLEPIK